MSNTITQNLGQSLLQPTQGQLTFSRVPNTTFYLQQTSVPGIVSSPATQPTPFTNLPVPGNKIEFTPLQVVFLLDEKMNSWYDIYNWMTGLGRAQSYDDYANLAANAPKNSLGIRPPYSDAVLTIFTAKNNPALQFAFSDCFPVELGGVQIDFREDAEVILTATAVFRYSVYTFSQISSTA